MTDHGRQFQCLACQFRSNQLKYEQQICSLRRTVKTMQSEVQELHLNFKIGNFRDMLLSPRELQTSEMQSQLTITMKYLEHKMQQLMKSVNDKLSNVQGKVIRCGQTIEEVRFTRWPFMIDDLQKALVQKNRHIEKYGQLVDKITDQKSHSQIFFKRQIKILQKLANDKKQLCQRLQEINNQLTQQNKTLKEEARQNNPLNSKTVAEISLHQSHPMGIPSQEQVYTCTKSQTTNIKLETSVISRSRNKVIFDLQTKKWQSNSKEEYVSKMPLTDRQQNRQD